MRRMHVLSVYAWLSQEIIKSIRTTEFEAFCFWTWTAHHYSCGLPVDLGSLWPGGDCGVIVTAFILVKFTLCL